MRVATIGSDPVLLQRKEVLRALPWVERAGAVGQTPSPETLEKVDVLFIGAPRGERSRLAGEALRCGVHLFLEWPPATSVRDCAALVRLAEEAGLECGVSRPLRFAGVFETVAEGWRADVIAMSMNGDRVSPDHGDAVPSPATRTMADAVDLACALAKTSSVRRVDAAAARNESAQTDATVFSLRFHSGAYAQVFIRLNGSAAPPVIYAAGRGVHVEGRMDGLNAALRRETEAFLAAIAENRPPPVSALDALQTMRIVERLQAHLR